MFTGELPRGEHSFTRGAAFKELRNWIKTPRTALHGLKSDRHFLSVTDCAEWRVAVSRVVD